MFEKDMRIGFLLDFYGDVLSEHTHSLLSMYYAEDLSLSEIGDSEGISRQGVRAAIKKGEEELRFLEDKLGLAAQFEKMRTLAASLEASAAALTEHKDASVRGLADEAIRVARVILSDFREEGDHVSKSDR